MVASKYHDPHFVLRFRGAGARGAWQLTAVVLMTVALGWAKPVKIVVLNSPSELVQVKVMVRAGSASDPAGREGLAALTGRMLLDGSFGDPSAPVTKDMLADIVRPWGEQASPSVVVEKETSTFSFTLPKGVFSEYAVKVMQPLFTQPLFAGDELERISKETKVYISATLRLENTELLGLYALDNYIHEGTPYGHLPAGTISGLKAITVEDVRRFYKTYYTAGNITVGVSSGDADIQRLIQSSLSGLGRSARAKKLRRVPPKRAPAIKGRELLVITQPTTIATGIHLGYPINVDRRHRDYWALYVANVALGTHRDSFGRLYNEIRQARGYNYGDYSYIEWFQNRPFALFPPTNTPRKKQYFSMWVRPAGHEYAHHLLKAIGWELENFVRDGLTGEEVELAKNKARVLYLNLAETSERLLAYKLDDDFYGQRGNGFLDGYLAAIDALTPAQVNAAIRRHLQVENLKIVIVTNEEWGARLATDIAAGQNAGGKDAAAYDFPSREVDDELVYDIPEDKRAVVEKDRLWEAYPLNLSAGRIRLVSSTQLFESARLIGR